MRLYVPTFKAVLNATLMEPAPSIVLIVAAVIGAFVGAGRLENSSVVLPEPLEPNFNTPICAEVVVVLGETPIVALSLIVKLPWPTKFGEMTNVPWLTVVRPVKLFVPDNVKVPEPVLVRVAPAPLSESMPE